MNDREKLIEILKDIRYSDVCNPMNAKPLGDKLTRQLADAIISAGFGTEYKHRAEVAEFALKLISEKGYTETLLGSPHWVKCFIEQAEQQLKENNS